MREEDQNPQGYDDEQTVPMLLTHLKRLRRSVPVNYQLKSDLKKQLLQRIKELEAQKKTSDVSVSQGRRNLIRVGLATLMVSIAFVSYGWWTKDAVSVREHHLLTLPAESSAEQVDLDATGTQIAYISQSSVLRTLSLDKDQKPLTVKLPPTEGKYIALSWANHGKSIAVVEQQQQQSRLWIVNLPDVYNLGSSRLLKEEEGVLYESPNWSQNDDTIAYSRTKNGVQEIWVSSTVSFQEWKLAEGSQPKWSPDGRFLSFMNDNEIHVMEMRTGKITVLGKGQWPSWSTDTQLTYTTPEGKLTEILLDEQPTVTREVTLFNRSSEKLIRANWSAKGKQLLLISHNEEPEALVISLASR
ncbi:TolB family protein [Brevibacillus sp. NRS-1366]|uniref:TolB family protein n=1 Tax=Brevibacillus sp. NRS-1366 TaxID=3233899 RepID=UPI003D198383